MKARVTDRNWGWLLSEVALLEKVPQATFLLFFCALTLVDPTAQQFSSLYQQKATLAERSRVSFTLWQAEQAHGGAG